eukprot:gnl/Dysnectes_brevis/1617_a1836_1580.p1 GENE.gnl/Dysnectes_brevis/1617_a1836_1580~~gnl/Dysnectes_brevis/1617_a1836_1580.p1  ORF type:complete len:1827 (+),score=560.84 gnl/Dysnectes_brevis/1617_a1836_1580:739-5481(+)
MTDNSASFNTLDVYGATSFSDNKAISSVALTIQSDAVLDGTSSTFTIGSYTAINNAVLTCINFTVSTSFTLTGQNPIPDCSDTFTLGVSDDNSNGELALELGLSTYSFEDVEFYLNGDITSSEEVEFNCNTVYTSSSTSLQAIELTTRNLILDNPIATDSDMLIKEKLYSADSDGYFTSTAGLELQSSLGENVTVEALRGSIELACSVLTLRGHITGNTISSLNVFIDVGAQLTIEQLNVGNLDLSDSVDFSDTSLCIGCYVDPEEVTEEATECSLILLGDSRVQSLAAKNIEIGSCCNIELEDLTPTTESEIRTNSLVIMPGGNLTVTSIYLQDSLNVEGNLYAINCHLQCTQETTCYLDTDTPTLSLEQLYVDGKFSAHEFNDVTVFVHSLQLQSDSRLELPTLGLTVGEDGSAPSLRVPSNSVLKLSTIVSESPPIVQISGGTLELTGQSRLEASSFQIEGGSEFSGSLELTVMETTIGLSSIITETNGRFRLGDFSGSTDPINGLDISANVQAKFTTFDFGDHAIVINGDLEISVDYESDIIEMSCPEGYITIGSTAVVRMSGVGSDDGIGAGNEDEGGGACHAGAGSIPYNFDTEDDSSIDSSGVYTDPIGGSGGGGRFNMLGGQGGGALLIYDTPSVTIEGELNLNGIMGSCIEYLSHPQCGGGGSGGSFEVSNVDELKGHGAILANGGQASVLLLGEETSYGGSGGGGVILVTNTTLDFSDGGITIETEGGDGLDGFVLSGEIGRQETEGICTKGWDQQVPGKIECELKTWIKNSLIAAGILLVVVAIIVVIVMFVRSKASAIYDLSGIDKAKLDRPIDEALMLGSPLEMDEFDDFQALTVDLKSLQPRRVLGTGASGSAYEGTYSGALVCIKTISVDLRDEKQRRSVLRECMLLSRIRHPHCLKLFGLHFTEREVIIVTELASGGSMEDSIVQQFQTHGKATPEYVGRCCTVLAQVAEALAFMHSLKPPVVHRDMKPDNILLRAPTDAVLADFGISRAVSDFDATMTATVCHGLGTLLMRADGSHVKVEDIEIGDQLMGDDGSPRTVHATPRGPSSVMYKLTTDVGEYTITEDHLLPLLTCRFPPTDPRHPEHFDFDQQDPQAYSFSKQLTPKQVCEGVLGARRDRALIPYFTSIPERPFSEDACPLVSFTTPDGEELSIRITPPVAWLIGIYMGDGFNEAAGISAKKDHMLPLVEALTNEAFKPLFHHVVAASPGGTDVMLYPTEDKKSGVYTINHAFFSFLKSAGFHRIVPDAMDATRPTKGQKTLPDALLSWHPTLKLAFLGGLVDSVGEVCTETETETDSQLTVQSQLLADLGFVPLVSLKIKTKSIERFYDVLSPLFTSLGMIVEKDCMSTDTHSLGIRGRNCLSVLDHCVYPAKKTCLTGEDGSPLKRGLLYIPKTADGKRVPVHVGHDLGSTFKLEKLEGLHPFSGVTVDGNHLYVMGDGTIQQNCGTPSYMAPEQIEGRVSTASDIYALGTCLYASIVGHAPFAEYANPLVIMRQLSVEGCLSDLSEPAIQEYPFAQKMIAACWARKRTKRPTAAMCVNLLLRMAGMFSKLAAEQAAARAPPPN